MGLRRIFLAMTLTLGGLQAVHAQELPADTVEALEAFYHNFNGDEWHNNEGWLDPETDPCDWHGVRCGSFAGEFGIQEINLADNNLAGSLEDGSEIFEHVVWGVKLPRNEIHGSLVVLPDWLTTLDLSDNRLTGTLPPGPDSFFNSLSALNLARNEIGGPVPASWRQLATSRMDLSNNQLEGSLEPLVFSGSSQGTRFMNVADNRFEGEIPSTLMQANFSSRSGINVCWNDLHMEDPELDAWLDEHHVGGDPFVSCLNPERLALGPEVSGSWFDPERDGEGVVLHLLPDGRAVHYTFGFDVEGQQHWLLGVGTQLDETVHWRRLKSERGVFGQGFADQSGFPHIRYPAMGWGMDWRMDRVGTDQFVIERTYGDFSHCADNSVMPCAGRLLSDRLEYLQLTRLAGTTCDNQDSNQSFSGAWYDPERDGEGFVVEVLEDGRGLVYWFTYRPDDSRHQAWMMGEGEFDGQTLQVDDLVQPTGGRWGEDFDPAAIERSHWGTLTLEFFDETSGHVTWNSVREGFGAGDHPITRLSIPRLADCEGS